MHMIRRPGQVVMIFALALPALLGFLGLALDGGYFLVSGRETQQAASAAARAAATELMGFNYATAANAGTAVGQKNLAVLGLSGTGITMLFKTGATPLTDCAPSATGWSSATPTSSTNCVKATASGTYNTLFLRLLGVQSATHQQDAVVTLGSGGGGLGIMPLSVCRADTSAATWVVWANGARTSSDPTCNVNSWDGLLDLITPRQGSGVSIKCQLQPNFPSFQAWIGPPPTTPAPEPSVGVNTTSCQYIATWIAAYPSPRISYVTVVDHPTGGTGGGATTIGVLGCRKVLLTPDTTRRNPLCGNRDCVLATPQDTTLLPCTNGSFGTFQEIY
jgi:hypothetical protein